MSVYSQLQKRDAASVAASVTDGDSPTTTVDAVVEHPSDLPESEVGSRPKTDI